MKTRKRIIAMVWGIAIIVHLLNLWGQSGRGMQSAADILVEMPFFFTLGVVGTLIVLRQPHNPVGWTFFGAFGYFIMDAAVNVMLFVSTDRFVGGKPLWAIPLGFVDAYMNEIADVVVWISLLIFPIIYFPNGKLSTPRWRYFVRAILALLSLNLLLGLFHPGLYTDMLPDFQNPLAIALVAKILDIAEVILIIGLIFPPMSLVFRFRSAKGVERQQIKWPLFSALIEVIAISWYFLAQFVFGAQEGDLAVNIGGALEAFTVISFPVTVGIAILRYRLYEIDIIIRRTLQYTLLTGILALIYFGSVVLTQFIFRSLTGNPDSPLITVISTLGIAALFNPLRYRIQDFIDQRFYRKKYDAEQALAKFATTARDEVDMEKLTNALLDVVKETMQPEHVSLWLRDVEVKK